MLCSFWLTAWVHISFPLHPAGLMLKWSSWEIGERSASLCNERIAATSQTYVINYGSLLILRIL
ncbi:hypothetical protein POSPLADRAFT_1171373 [Postia placenta MAD-698-R-SB12]|uniref:Uncharacterized protein n=1 Tax=Postia placenta MAD-698-R-SB12 TaxID=670580 RepID=A0A1X6MVQ6_9APHY|nr:hypothetical protein POSPLADRAFT_1171373 [Postia placenta MAD-698-R-SB12]OSX60306.1 hypothetical protein POSPLADRAFT_1171373 [Postia placenta MAD-698-R-SB12]